jgi:hypothetical protein
LNRRIEVLQTSALPLGYRALTDWAADVAAKKIAPQEPKSERIFNRVEKPALRREWTNRPGAPMYPREGRSLTTTIPPSLCPVVRKPANRRAAQYGSGKITGGAYRNFYGNLRRERATIRWFAPKNRHNMTAYQEKLRQAISKVHGSDAVHVATVPVRKSDDDVRWEGNVEVFDLLSHPTAKRSYAWGYPVGEVEPSNIFAILEVPPIDSAEKAVKVAMGGRAS